MKPPFNPSLGAIAFLAASLLPLMAAEPDADQLLRGMSAKLAAAKSFSFEAIREIDGALLEGQKLPEKASVTVAVQRPSQIAVRAESDLGVRRFVADGTTAWLSDEKMNHYTTLPMKTNLDGLVDQLDEKYGFMPPLAEFALSDPYKEFKSQAQSVTYLGLDKTTGEAECHHIALKGKEADAELWIAVSDQLPRKLTATFHTKGQPQVRIAFSKWNLEAPVSAAEFTFTPPKDAQKIEMWTPAKMQAHREFTKQHAKQPANQPEK